MPCRLNNADKTPQFGKENTIVKLPATTTLDGTAMTEVVTLPSQNWKENYEDSLKSLLEKVVKWNPDYVVPVGRKCGKLFRLVVPPDSTFHQKVFYKQYFEFLEIPLGGKNVAVIDDSVRHGSALREYRNFFEGKGAKEVRTFGLIGHAGLRDGTHVSYDPKMRVEVWLGGPSYEDYLFSQSQYLLEEGFYQDVHHLVLEIDLGATEENLEEKLISLLETKGCTYFVRPYSKENNRFSVLEPSFFLKLSELHPASGFFGGINKIRFHLSKTGKLICVPMVVPRLDGTKECPISKWKTPFVVPCQRIHDRPHHPDKLCYWSISLLLSAELGRTFFQFLKSTGLQIFNRWVSELQVRKVDFVRYLGPEIGDQLSDELGRFLKLQDYEPDRDLVESLCGILLPRDLRSGSGDFSRAKMSGVIEHLKSAYEERVRLAGTRVGVHYSLNLDQIQNMSNLHMLPLMEALDSYCDLGILVPSLDDQVQPIERHWRSGEPEAVFAWNRTTFLVPVAIRTAVDELGIKDSRVGAMLLMKLLANISYDYHERCQPLRRLHCFKRKPYRFGTCVTAQDDHAASSPVDIYNFKKLGNRYKYEETTPDDGFFWTDDPLDPGELARWFDNKGSISLDQIIAYLSFLTNLKEKFGSVDILTALSICRTRDTFLLHIYANMDLWLENFRVFLDDLKRLPYSEDIHQGPLHVSGANANSGVEKIKLWKDFPGNVNRITREMSQIRFKIPVTTIRVNMESLRERELPILGAAERLVSIQRALTGIAIAKLMPEIAPREPGKMFEWGEMELNEKHRFAFDVVSFRKVANIEVIKEMLTTAYYRVFQEVEGLPKATDEETELQSKAFRRMAMNQGIAVVTERGWKHPAFVHLDLTGFRGAGQSAEAYIQQLYSIAALNSSNFGGECVTKDPGGNDYLLFVFYDILPALRMAASTQSVYTKQKIPVKFGVERTDVTVGSEYDSVISAMGRAKDLCEYKNLPNYANAKDILISSRLTEYLRASGILPQAYFELVERIAFEKEGLKGTEIGVYRLLWEKLLEDKR